MRQSGFIKEVVGKNVVVTISDGYDYENYFILDSVESAKNFLINYLNSNSSCYYDSDDMKYLKNLGDLGDNEDDITLLNLAFKKLSNDDEVYHVCFKNIIKMTEE